MAAYGPRGDRPSRDGRAELARAEMLEPGSGVYVVPKTGVAEIFVWGGGGSGDSVTASRAGAGAGAAKRRVFLVKGQRLAYTVGAGGAQASTSIGSTGGTTTIELPNGITLGATGGAGGGVSGATAAGGLGFGGDLNRRGGSASTGAGDPGENGADGGAASTGGGGGGAAGFDDLGELFKGGAGTDGENSDQPALPDYGGGSGASATGLGQAGGPGRIAILLLSN